MKGDFGHYERFNFVYFGRNVRLLWFTLGREYLKCKEHGDSDISEQERNRRRQDPDYSDYWQKKVNIEKSTPTFLTAIATHVEDAPEIILALYVICVRREKESAIGQFCLLIIGIKPYALYCYYYGIIL